MQQQWRGECAPGNIFTRAHKLHRIVQEYEIDLHTTGRLKSVQHFMIVDTNVMYDRGTCTHVNGKTS